MNTHELVSSTLRVTHRAPRKMTKRTVLRKSYEILQHGVWTPVPLPVFLLHLAAEANPSPGCHVCRLGSTRIGAYGFAKEEALELKFCHATLEVLARRAEGGEWTPVRLEEMGVAREPKQALRMMEDELELDSYVELVFPNGDRVKQESRSTNLERFMLDAAFCIG